jgi:hypothetical protein
MTKQPEISRDSAASLPLRSRPKGPIESMTQFQPDKQLRPFTKDTHLGIMIEWRPYVRTYGRPGAGGGGRSC